MYWHPQDVCSGFLQRPQFWANTNETWIKKRTQVLGFTRRHLELDVQELL